MLIAKVLGEYEEQLSNAGFVRTHRSHLVNRQYITFIDGQGNIVMEDNSRIEISRRKRKEVMTKLKKTFMHTPLAA
jgi:two-component system LytT family response regulator